MALPAGRLDEVGARLRERGFLNRPLSTAERLALLPAPERTRILDGLTGPRLEELVWDWDFWARPSQKEPAGDWLVWLLLTGRGFGKTRVGAEWIGRQARMYPRLALIGRTYPDVRDDMIEGDAGILPNSPPWFRPLYEPSKRRVVWPNGAFALIFTADEPEGVRNKQFYKVWADEVAAWQHAERAWDNMMFGLRLGPDPQVLATTTPKPVPLILRLLDPDREPGVALTGGESYENVANLSPKYITQVLNRYRGTRLEAQEIRGKLLKDNPDAPYRRAWIADGRVARLPEAGLRLVVVAVDPAGGGAAEIGIVGGGVARLEDGLDHAFILADKSRHGSPDEWGKEAVSLAAALQADEIVGERNFGGDMVEHVIRTVDPRAAFRPVVASRGKAKRYEPVASLYRQGRVHHVGSFPEMEDQMCQIDADDKTGALQDRRDADAWLVWRLLIPEEPEPKYGETYGVG